MFVFLQQLSYLFPYLVTSEYLKGEGFRNRISSFSFFFVSRIKKMLIDLFQKSRETEPISIVWVRRIVIAILLFLLIVLLVILLIGVFNEEPSIRRSYKKYDKIAAPGEDISF